LLIDPLDFDSHTSEDLQNFCPAYLFNATIGMENSGSLVISTNHYGCRRACANLKIVYYSSTSLNVTPRITRPSSLCPSFFKPRFASLVNAGAHPTGQTLLSFAELCRTLSHSVKLNFPTTSAPVSPEIFIR
jgi:hypothetical protein